MTILSRCLDQINKKVYNFNYKTIEASTNRLLPLTINRSHKFVYAKFLKKSL